MSKFSLKFNNGNVGLYHEASGDLAMLSGYGLCLQSRVEAALASEVRLKEALEELQERCTQLACDVFDPHPRMGNDKFFRASVDKSVLDFTNWANELLRTALEPSTLTEKDSIPEGATIPEMAAAAMQLPKGDFIDAETRSMTDCMMTHHPSQPCASCEARRRADKGAT